MAFNDVDLTDTHTAAFVAAVGNTTALGTFELDSVSETATEPGSVGWSYTLTNSAAQYLGADESRDRDLHGHGDRRGRWRRHAGRGDHDPGHQRRSTITSGRAGR